MVRILAYCGFALLFLCAGSATAQDNESATDVDDGTSETPQFAVVVGPTQVAVQLRLDAERSMPTSRFGRLGPYWDWKARLNETTGFGFGLDYTAVGLGSGQSLGDAGAVSGNARLYGRWIMVDRGGAFEGGLIFMGEYRHAYTDLPPSQFAADIGYVGQFEPPFNGEGLRLSSFYWRQHFLDRRLLLAVGYLRPVDYIDVYALGSPYLHLFNLAFSTGSATILPAKEGFGVAFAAWFTRNLYAIASLNDANATPTEPFDTFGSFFTENEYFVSLELGFTRGEETTWQDNNIHVTVWHTDESRSNATPSGWGIVGSASYYFIERLVTFVRGGYSKDGDTLLSGSLSAGVGYQQSFGEDLVAFAFNWGRPNRSTFGDGLDDQYTFELLYRLQVAKELAITPDLQLIVNPAANPRHDVAWVFGLRTRLAI